MDIVALLPFVVLIGAMFLMTRSAKNKQRAAAKMRTDMQPGTGVRTIGGLYATVKEVNDDTIVVEIAPGVHATFAKNAIGAVLEDEEYDRIVNGHVEDDDALEGDELDGDLVVPDSPAGLEVDLSKDARHDDADDEPEDADAVAEDEPATVDSSAKKDAPKKGSKDAAGEDDGRTDA